MTRDSANDPAPRAHAKKRRHLRGWLVNLVLIVVAFGALQWWKSRPLASGPAPPLAGVTLSGRAFDLQAVGPEPILVHFWATWCPVCQLMDGTIEAIAKDYRVITVAPALGHPAGGRALHAPDRARLSRVGRS
jgi:hypothetical protein